MSGNINDTKVEQIKLQINLFINDLDKTIESGESILDFEETYKDRYNYLFTTSKTLYTYIFKQYNTERFNKHIFQRNIDMMLSAIEKIQISSLTQHQAST